MRGILSTEDYRLIRAKLLQVIQNYSGRLRVSSGRVTPGPYKIQMGAWKFNQYYNVVPGKEEDRYKFVKQECISGMEELNVPIAGARGLVIGSAL